MQVFTVCYVQAQTNGAMLQNVYTVLLSISFSQSQPSGTHTPYMESL